jgi:lactoylglutathione lyase
LHIAQVDTYGTIKINKVLHLAFTTNDFEGYLKYLNEQGIKYFNFNEKQNKIQIRPDGVRQIYFQDPDEYWIEINDAKHH